MGAAADSARTRGHSDRLSLSVDAASLCEPFIHSPSLLCLPFCARLIFFSFVCRRQSERQYFELKLSELMSRQTLGCKTCPACRSSLMCPAAQPGQARAQCSECRRRGVITHFCLLCEQTWKASSMRQEASCGNLSCQATKITVLELMRVGGLPENRKTIGNITNVPDNRSCPRKECRRKFGQCTSMQTVSEGLGRR